MSEKVPLSLGGNEGLEEVRPSRENYLPFKCYSICPHFKVKDEEVCLPSPQKLPYTGGFVTAFCSLCRLSFLWGLSPCCFAAPQHPYQSLSFSDGTSEWLRMFLLLEVPSSRLFHPFSPWTRCPCPCLLLSLLPLPLGIGQGSIPSLLLPPKPRLSPTLLRLNPEAGSFLKCCPDPTFSLFKIL